MWFRLNRRGGTVVLHHRHIRPVLIRDWSRPMDGITATIWASQTTSHPVEVSNGATATPPPSTGDTLTAVDAPPDPVIARAWW